jgi:hypothetical protein
VIRLTVFVRRKAGMSDDAFHARWRAHGRMIASHPEFARYIRRYEQHHRGGDDRGIGSDHDGVAVQWFDDVDGFLALLRDPAYEQWMRPDEDEFLDRDSLVFLLTDDVEVFIG